VGQFHPLDSLLPDYPLNPSYADELGHNPLREVNDRTDFKVKLDQPLVRPEESEYSVGTPTAFHETRRVPAILIYQE